MPSTGIYMLDTNVFNYVLDGKIDVADLQKYQLVATHVQRDELRNTKDDTRRESLLKIFEELTPDMESTTNMVAGISVAGAACAGSNGVIRTESAVWGVSRWGGAKWGSNDGVFDAMRGDLNALNKKKGNNTHDILIAETALRHEFVLITADADLFTIMTKYGGACGNPFLLSTAKTCI